MNSRSVDQIPSQKEGTDEYDMELSNSTPVTSQSKRSRQVNSASAQKDLNWVRSILLPSMAQQFVRFDVVKVINTSRKILICQLSATGNNYFAEYTSISGYFNIWWWEDMLKVVEKSHLENMKTHFPFFKRICDQENLIKDAKISYLLLCDPKFVTDRSNPDQLLVSCKRFIIID